ncbi:UNVERIFIED_CONTAM: Adenylate isopentenyltransferase [Sesamum calycinum]|uniref:Adenylate isopentenyltransferase n=1 Tax=Sesamum calycinum TaxID=2727403 RepID=A0AAW2SWT6_9LAMI
MSTPSVVRRQQKSLSLWAQPAQLSVDLASRFFPSSEIINSDKIQVYRGLDITTNKISLPERKNVRHHLLGDFGSSDSHPSSPPPTSALLLPPSFLRFFPAAGCPSLSAAQTPSSTHCWQKFNPELDVFSESNSGKIQSFAKSSATAAVFSGDVRGASRVFENPGSDSVSKCGLKKAIGVPEFERYFQTYIRKTERCGRIDDDDDDEEKRVAYEEAVRAIKDNTCQLAKRQLGKILRLRDGAGWDLKRVDSTASLRAAMEGGGRRMADIWERQVVEPSVKIVKQFLME